ncbi:MAG: CotH kinase family protein [Bacteroidota bacterium]
MKFTYLIFIFLSLLIHSKIFSQLKINEGCNKNYQSLLDENEDASDWIELYNSGTNPINLSSYFLSDNNTSPQLWQLPPVTMNPGEYQTVFCSGKDRSGSEPFTNTLNQTAFTPVNGWNQHVFSTPFIWDGVSNVILNVCSYNSTQYTTNSSFYQSSTSFASSLVTFNDGNDYSCSANLGALYNQRPNIKFNSAQIGFGTIQNSGTDYPAPYGNWYWCARHQFLFKADELIAAGLSAGMISSISFQVAGTSGEFYDYISLSMNHTSLNELETSFTPIEGNGLHTNFKLDGNGETVYLFNDSEQLVQSLLVQSPQSDVSVGLFPDGSSTVKWMEPSPEATNNLSESYTDTLKEPIFSIQSGVYSSVINVSLVNPNSLESKLVFTLDGTTPTINSPVFDEPIQVIGNTVIRAKIFPITTNGVLASNTASSTYLIGVAHTTPILMVTTDGANLYGPEGIFDNFNSDWIKPAHAVYLKEGVGHPFLFETRTAMRMDGGAGGSRSQPQHSFRLSFAHGALGEKPIEYPLIPDRPNRTKYSDIYLRNGSNQYLVLPYKDASQVRMMSEGTANYYSAYRPVSVYINGQYFGLYELREKFNSEYFEVHDGANRDSLELLSLSYFYNLVLRSVEGDVDNFWSSYESFLDINPNQTNYWSLADQHFDLKHYTDYVIGESWMGNTDWPQNNIKIYRSDKTNKRWRFALIDLELSLQPNGWSSCTDNHIRYLLDRDPNIPYINIWLRSVQNEFYRNYFINRFADLMNTSYSNEKILATEESFFLSMYPEMDNEYTHWGDPNNIQGQLNQFNENHLVFRSELACRNAVIRNNLVSEFNLTKKVNVKLAVEPDSSGFIQLNTIKPENYPWTGVYFDGVPVDLSPVAAPGYEFSHWKPNIYISDTLADSLSCNVSITNTLFTAVFTKIPEPPDGPDIHFTLYPNPASEQFIIEHDNKTLAAGCRYEIYDLNGRKIQVGEINSNALTTQIGISQLRSTMYLIRISQGNSTLQTFRFVKG